LVDIVPLETNLIMKHPGSFKELSMMRVVRDEEEGEEESAREGAFQLDMTDEQATTLHDLLPDAQRSKVKYD
jgi:hypothetical protein